jgi:hypothetical protein
MENKQTDIDMADKNHSRSHLHFIPWAALRRENALPSGGRWIEKSTFLSPVDNLIPFHLHTIVFQVFLLIFFFGRTTNTTMNIYILT